MTHDNINEHPKKELTMFEGDIAETIAGRLEQVLIEKEVQQDQIRKQMAAICDITPQAIAQWFDGRTKAPGATHIAAICAYFEADLMWVITGHPNAHTYAQALKKRMAREGRKIVEPKKKKTISKVVNIRQRPTSLSLSTRR